MTNGDDDYDWTHDEEMWEDGEEEGPKPACEVECLRCLHRVSPDNVICPWCGTRLEEGK